MYLVDFSLLNMCLENARRLRAGAWSQTLLFRDQKYRDTLHHDYDIEWCDISVMS